MLLKMHFLLDVPNNIYNYVNKLLLFDIRLVFYSSSKRHKNNFQVVYSDINIFSSEKINY